MHFSGARSEEGRAAAVVREPGGQRGQHRHRIREHPGETGRHRAHRLQPCHGSGTTLGSLQLKEK